MRMPEVYHRIRQRIWCGIRPTNRCQSAVPHWFHLQENLRSPREVERTNRKRLPMSCVQSFTMLKYWSWLIMPIACISVTVILHIIWMKYGERLGQSVVYSTISEFTGKNGSTYGYPFLFMQFANNFFLTI